MLAYFLYPQHFYPDGLTKEDKEDMKICMDILLSSCNPWHKSPVHVTSSALYEHFQPEQLVFADESHFNHLSLQRNYGWAP